MKAIILSIFIAVLSATSIYAAEWYEGGTLHRSKISQWSSASFSNRLATCADFIANRPQAKRLIRSAGTVDAIKDMAYELEKCVSTTAAGGEADTMSVAEVGAMCMILLGYK